jgi:hypothetical protein
MESDHFNFKDRIKEIETSFVKDGWVTVFENSENTNQNQYMIFCCLVTEQRIKSYRETTGWVIDPGHEGKPSIIGSFDDGEMANAYHQFADDGIEPLIFLRVFIINILPMLTSRKTLSPILNCMSSSPTNKTGGIILVMTLVS